VCAGGGVTGAVYEIGCLRALEHLLDRSVLDLDLYVGVSGGAFVASMLADGVSPADMYDEIVGRSRRPLGVDGAPLCSWPDCSPRLSEKGVTYVLDQALRIMLHGRMQYGMERYRAEHPEVDVLLVEPAGHDLRMFSYNIMRYSARRELAEHGYRSVLATFRRRRRDHARVLARHGIGLRRTPPAHGPAPRRYASPVARSLAAELGRLGSALGDRGR
jgi:hypothetical protein